jgi:hypothetical protein
MAQEFLEHLLSSELESDDELHVHVCNNLPERQAEREALATKVRQARIERRAQSFLADKGGTSPTVVQVTIHDMKGNVGGFARFALARTLRAKGVAAGDYIVMVDDDMLVKPKTIATVWKQRQPNSFGAWFGKNWAADGSDYWHPRMPRRVARLQKGENPEVTTWQYGGTGMSVLDARMLDHPSLFRIPDEYLFVEDLWLSYVVHAASWPVHRIFAKFEMPAVDTGNDPHAQWTQLMETKKTMLEELQRCSPNYFRDAA